MTLDKLQLTAFKVLRNNVVTLLILGLFPFDVGLRVRNGNLVPFTNWPRLLILAVLLPGLYFVILLIVQLTQNAADARRERAGNLVFPGAIGWRVVLFVFVVFLVVIDIGIYRQTGRVQTWEVAFAAAMGLMVLYCWPRPIEFSDGAILQNKTFGGMKSILFSDVVAARYDARQQCIIISGKNGVTLVHSMLHAGRKQFARQLKLLTGVDVFGLMV